MKKKLIIRVADRGLPDIGMEHVITYGELSYKVYCTFAFHVWFERVYNGRVLGLDKGKWLSIRGLMDRSLDRNLHLPVTELMELAKVLIVDWFGLELHGVPEPNQVKRLNYHFAFIMGLLLGGADAGKKLFPLLGMAQILINTKKV